MKAIKPVVAGLFLSLICFQHDAFGEILDSGEHRKAIGIISSTPGVESRIPQLFDREMTLRCYYAVATVIAWERRGELSLDSNGRVGYGLLYEVAGRAYAYHFGSDRGPLQEMLNRGAIPNNQVISDLGICLSRSLEVVNKN